MIESTKLPNLRFLLRKAGVTQASIAHALEVSPSAVSQVVLRQERAIRIELAIAQRLGMEATDLFEY